MFSDIETLKKVAKAAESRMKFIARARVDSEALFCLDRRICVPGDEVEVIRWYCEDGPTEIRVKSRELGYKASCIPFL